ncbi:hypothetical protein Q6257_28320, partial [Klebsiella variicola]
MRIEIPGNAWLVESDMPIGAQSQHRKVYAAGRSDGAIERATFLIGFGSITTQEIDLILGCIDAVDQMASHEGMI